MLIIHNYDSKLVLRARSKYFEREEAQDWQSCGDVNNANYDILLSDKKIVLAVEGLEPFFDKILRQTLGENALIIAAYISAIKREINISDGYRKSNIHTLAHLSKFSNIKNFNEMIREYILLYLDSFRKPEASDPLHKWIGTYTLRRGLIVKFFKWLYHPEGEVL